MCKISQKPHRLGIERLRKTRGLFFFLFFFFSKFFFFFFFKPFLYVFQGSGGACVGEEANLGNKLFQANPAARTKEKELKRPLFIVPGGPAGVPVFQPHMTPFCLWVLENKTPTLITLS